MSNTIQEISNFLNCTSSILSNDTIEYLLIDSRKISVPKSSLFFALSGPRRDGHEFIEEVFNRGVTNFIVKKSFSNPQKLHANFLYVDDVLKALQQIAAQHRKQFNYPVIGITGSNGKTIVKEWLNQLLQPNYNIVRSPRSYNSQIGVPISVWQMNAHHNLAIFEAGISTVNEMAHLQKIIQPTIGILTNIGNAHDDGFENTVEKIKEKSLLFSSSEIIITNGDEKNILEIVNANSTATILTWGKSESNNLIILSENKSKQQTTLEAKFDGEKIVIVIPFTDNASIQNTCTCWLTLLFFKISNEVIAERMMQLHAVEMRMQLLSIPNNCVLINDSYSNDISSFNIGLDYLKVNAGDSKKTIIISDFAGIQNNSKHHYLQIIQNIKSRKIDRIITIGKEWMKFESELQAENFEVSFYKSTDDFFKNQSSNHFKNEYILLKGARVFNFEKINFWLQQKTHQTVMEISLTALQHNLKAYQKHLNPQTKTMAMVKAFSYGSGSVEIAKILQFNKVDYLGVAYTDEGVELRKAGISLPIMVLNIDSESFDDLLEYNLEPEIFSTSIYKEFDEYLINQAIQNFPIHIKLNTGMNRLGFDEAEVNELCKQLTSNKTVLVKSVLSHLVASEDEKEDDFTKQQIELFKNLSNKIEKNVGYSFIKHIANSAAIFRIPEAEFDMVRLGIGLYGVDSANINQLQLQTVATLKTTIAQIRKVNKTATIGYNRNGKLERDSIIATVRIGYADGLNRLLGNKKGVMFLHGKLAPIVGNVCMDMTMIDITEIPDAKENDVVEIFGGNISVQQVAKNTNTIAYETLSTINQRVRRIYIEE